LARSAIIEETSPLDLKSTSDSVHLLDGIVSLLPCRRELDAQDVGGFVLGDFARDPQRLAGQAPLLLSQLLRLAKDCEDLIIFRHRSLLRPYLP